MPSETGATLDSRYLRALWATARECGVDNDGLHDAAFVGFGKSSLKELTEEEAKRLLDGMRKASGVAQKRPAQRRWAQGNHGRRDVENKTEYLVNKREMTMLCEAAALRGWNEEALLKFIARQLGNTEIRTMKEFNKIFWAIKAMNRRDSLHA
jgi:hypothetical protein